MIININKIITMGNKEKYLVIEKVTVENEDYVYVAELNKSENDILDNYKIAKIREENNNIFLDEIIGEDKLKKILPSFVESLSN